MSLCHRIAFVIGEQRQAFVRILMSSENHFLPGNTNRGDLATAAEQDAAAAKARSPRALIVEDEIFVAWHLESLVRDLQLEVCGLVPDGEGAIELADNMEPDLVLMDISLSGQLDGVEAARRIREKKNVPVIFITAYSDAATVARINREVPGSQVLGKPVSGDRLRSAIDGALPGWRP
jgi:two-component system, response regulator PdtaR